LSCEVLNYEAPFGVGYLVAQITNQKSSSQNTPNNQRSETTEGEPAAGEGEELPALAREVVETFVLTGSQIKRRRTPRNCWQPELRALSRLRQATVNCAAASERSNHRVTPWPKN